MQRHSTHLSGRSSFPSSRAVSGCSQSADSGTRQRYFVYGRSGLGDALLRIGVEQLIRIQFRRVAGKIEDGDLLYIFLEPFFIAFE
jgi:hypothetical protein